MIIMNKRIRNKIYKIAENKLDNFRTLHNDKRTYLQIAKGENVLSGLEKKIFIEKQNKIIRITNEILSEIKMEENNLKAN